MRWPLLRHRDFVKLWAGQSVSALGSIVGRTALPMLIVITMNASPLQVSLVRTLEIAPGLVAGLFAGVWVDRARRLPIMVGADLGRALLLASIPLAYLAGRLGMGHIYAVALMVSVLTVLFDVAYQSYLPTLVKGEQLVQANSLISATNSVGEIAGFGVGGMLVQWLTGPITLLVDAVSFLVSSVSLMLIRAPEARDAAPEEETRSTFREIREGLSSLFDHPVLRALSISRGIDSLFGNIIGTVIHLFVLRELGLSPGVAGSLYALGGISSFFGAALATPALRRFGLGPTIVGSGLVGAVATLFLALAGGPLWAVVALMAAQQLIGDGAMTMHIIHGTSLRQSVTPDRVMGRVNASLQVTDWSFMLVGTLLGGVLGESIGLRGALLVAVAGKLLAVAWLYFSPVRQASASHPPEEAGHP